MKRQIRASGTFDRMLYYCKRCVMPSTKPDLFIEEGGICSACRSYEQRAETDWEKRRQELSVILDQYRSKDGRNWDCVIPVSGGKDSTFQTVKILELGMNPLCVTSTTCDLSRVGRANIDNIRSLGVDCIEFTPNKVVRRKLNRIGLTSVGDISWAEHVGIFTIPVRVAVNYGVSLIVWGENSQNEYGGPAAAAENHILDRRWLEEFGGLLGLRVSDLAGLEGFCAKDLLPYTYPSDKELRSAKSTGVFLGYYFPWDGHSNAIVAKKHGFTAHSGIVEGSIVDYENLDNHQTGIHDYFKFLKFGFGRATDLACLHVRRDKISRQEAVWLVNKHDGKFPWTYLGKPVERILEPLEMTVDEFITICDRFTNRKLFKTNKSGKLVKDESGNLVRLFPLS